MFDFCCSSTPSAAANLADSIARSRPIRLDPKMARVVAVVFVLAAVPWSLREVDHLGLVFEGFFTFGLALRPFRAYFCMFFIIIFLAWP